MSQHIHYKPFDAATVALQGSNLIEASAGTGKTYSIAILVLRLVLEQQLSVKDILMVTFTKAAVAELEERIRLFIRKAYKATQGERIDDPLIAQLVAEAMEREPAADVQRRLWTAVLLLDETSVLTIHSFCQITLSEFAFETGQVFGATLQQDSSKLLQEAVQDCWRKHITTLPIPLLMALRQASFSQGSLLQVLKEHLAGKRYRAFDETKCYAFDDSHHKQWLTDLGTLQKAHRHLVQCLEEKITERKEALIKLCANHANASKLCQQLDKPAQFLKTILEKRATGYITKFFSDILEELDLCAVEEQKYLDARQRVFDDLCCLAIQEARKHIEVAKQKQHLLTFDDLIGNLHTALVQRPNPRLEEALRNKYKAVFIDEFQDTDRQQYEVFETAFGKDTLLFYIGDPKQSIYAWRKADIFTYFKARASVDSVYDMDRNFRSSAPMIEAMNQVFLPHVGFDTFYFQNESATIDYHAVRSPEPNSKGLLLQGGAPAVPICISEHKNKEALYDALTGQVVALLTDGVFSIEKNKEKGPRPVTPSDIGILVRTRRQAAAIRDRLQHYGIPAITVGDEKVLQSDEAMQLLFLLQAIEEPTLAHISRALLTPFTGVPASHLLQLDEEVAITLFRSYRTTWEQYGVYKALMDLAAYFNVRARLLQTPNGERILTNLVHLTELLHRVQTRNRLSPLELIAWLKRGVEGMEVEGDEYEQRIESDEEAVKIVTIHKSKGLEYNIVLAPHLDLLPDEKHITFVSYRHPDDGSYIGCEKARLNDAEKGWVQRQTEQENRRLFYVALTRAVYQCYIFRSLASTYNLSTLNTFMAGEKYWSPQLVQQHTPPEVPEGYRYRLQGTPALNLSPIATSGRPVHFVLKEAEWVRSSFSGLALQKTGHAAKPSGAEHSNDYDRFMFGELEKGVRTGNMLHALLEVVDFTRDTRWEQQVQQVVQQFAPSKAERYQPMLLQMLQELLQAPITITDTTFTLAQVAYHERLHEFEFDMRVPLFSPAQLNTLSGEGIQVQVKNGPRREGLLNGIMDLFFAYQGRYYILDWKSNYLGDRVSDYGTEQMAAAMNEHNYHLQYLLYTLAAVRYLRSRLGNAFDYDRDFGGVIYLFVRGVRREGGQGIFTNRPTKAQLQTLEQILCAAQQPLVQGVLLDAAEAVG